MKRILMSPPDVGALEEQYVVRALRSGWVAPTGPEVAAFESEMSARTGVPHAVALSSGTAALHLAMLGVGVRRDDVVLVPTMTFVASANAVLYLGARPCFVDVHPESGNLDPDELQRAVVEVRSRGGRVGAVMSVDLFGKCADYSRINDICAEADIPLVEDAAEALGASFQGEPAGSFGRVSALSFNGNKIMTTSGGGMLLTRSGRLADRARFLSTQAREPSVHYEHKEMGFNYRMSNILAALGRAQLDRLDEMIKRRRATRARYKELVAGWTGIEVFGGRGDQEDNCWLTSLVVDLKAAGFTAQDLGRYLESHGIESRPLWKPMHMQPLFANARRFETGVARDLYATGLTLPSGSSLRPEEAATVSAVISEFVENR